MKLGLTLRSRRIWIPYFSLGITLFLTALATYYVAKAAETREQLRFENAVQSTQNKIQNRIETYEALLRSGSGLFAVNNQANLQEFRNYVERLELHENYPGVQGIGFSRRIRPSEVEAVVADMKRQGVEDFQISPAGDRPEFHAVLYLEPLDVRNQAALGYDMFTEAVRRAAMEAARDTGLPAATGRVTLLQDIEAEKQAGFLIYVPLYQGQTPKTVAERRNQLLGYVYSPFRVDDLLAGTVSSGQYQYVSFQIYDGTVLDADHLLHRSDRNAATNDSVDHLAIDLTAQSRFTTTRQLEVGGRLWTIAFTSRPEINLASGRNLVPYVFLSGVLMSMVLFGVTRSQAQSRAAAEQFASSLLRSELALRESETRQRFALEAANMVAWEWYPDTGKIIYSDNVYQVFGLPTTLPLKVASDFFELIHPSDRNAVRQRLKEAIAQRSNYTTEFRLLPPDGKVQWIADQGRVTEDDTESTLRVSSVLQNITQRKAAEAALQESEHRYAQILDSVQDMVFCKAPGSIIVYANKATCEYYAKTLEELRGIIDLPLSDPDHTHRYFQDDLQVFSTGKTLEISEEPITRADGAVRFFSTIKTPVFDTAGNVVQIVAVARDITERKQVEAERMQLLNREQAARAEAETANRLKDEFLATLSHELRTPLNAMMGWTQLLHTRQFDETTTHQALGTIYRNTKLLNQLIEDLLDVSRIMTGKFHLNMRPIRLNTVIRDAMEAVRTTAQKKGVEMQLQQTDGESTVIGDYTRLQQVLWNLLSNAIKFTPQGGRVDIRLDFLAADPPLADSQLDQKLAQITVTDTGQGIPPDFLPNIFERFRQADGTITRAHGGLGLGLSIVRHIVEMHGGQIRASSEGQGQGATFTVQLPLAAEAAFPAQLPSATPTPAQPTPKGDRPTHSSSEDLADLKILVVDDEADARELMMALLAESGAKPTVVSSAQEAMDVLTQADQGDRPDILISDIGMPHEDGYKLIHRVRALPAMAGGQIPAIALTAYARSEERMHALQAGFQMHIPKPVEPERLIRAIATLVQPQS